MKSNVSAIVAFDLETIANRSLTEFLPPIRAKATLKDPVKIAADIAEKKEKQITEMGLNPHYNIICSFGWADSVGNAGYIMLEEESREAEAALIVGAWEILFKYEHFVTFNGIAFDVPLLNLHSLFLRCRPAAKISIRKYMVENHTDLRAILGGWDKFAPGKLDFYMKRLFGTGKPEDIDGSMVQHYWDVGLRDEIGIYCQQDAVDVMKFYKEAKKFHPEVN